MIENKEGISDIDFVLDLIRRQDWVDEDILMLYEDCYRIARKLLLRYDLDTKELDTNRNEIMRLYGQL